MKPHNPGKVANVYCIFDAVAFIHVPFELTVLFIAKRVQDGFLNCPAPDTLQTTDNERSHRITVYIQRISQSLLVRTFSHHTPPNVSLRVLRSLHALGQGIIPHLIIQTNE